MHIGFIDSGVGGLSVYQHVKQRVPARYTYLMDNKYLPYGEKSESFIQQRLLQLSAYLIEQGAELIVIACNTATTQAVNYLRQHFSVPFVGVVPAIKPAAALSKGMSFSVLATPATCNSDYLQGLIQQFAPTQTVIKVGSSELVRLAEEKVWYRTDVRQQVADILTVSPIPDSAGHIVVLGCTHFPFLSAEIKATLSEEIVLLDTGLAIGNRVAQLVADWPVHIERGNDTFISTRELLPAQVERLGELGFDQHHCWPMPLTN
ncbi:glutamate racemase [Rheinheimera sp. SA_1]|uniref:glutamate racemase n=1 Tax=Rheinheimera sp. SA_1 TaxID=1827365 RepID=UPI0007FB93E4|nr:glutamate racemase [Rheinheimera sp. SA_1]OBP13293.1 glutamate racemase [Rheinheimera sp. SA_1]